MADAIASAVNPGLSDAVQRYLSQDLNRAHYCRTPSALPTDGASYAAEIVDLRRKEIGQWRRTWWERLARHPDRILDAGCGPGFVAAALSDELPESVVVGVDIEPEAVLVANLLAKQRPNLSAHESSLEQLPSGLGAFDLIICRTTLEHVFDPKAALEQLLDALTPGGALFLETPNYLFPFEPHVRLWMPPKCPKRLLRFECRLFGRDPAFVDQLQLACDPRTLARWARARGSFEVTDLMHGKVLDVLTGRRASAVGWRQRVANAVGVIGRSRPGLLDRIAGLPIWPSVQLLIVRHDSVGVAS